MALKTLLIAALSLCPVASYAGDPCPIGVELVDLGTPPWLDRDEILGGLQSQDTWVGINYENVSNGLELHIVYPGSPAEEAGLQVEDIVTKIDGAPVGNDNANRAAFDGLANGRSAQFSVLRRGQSLDITVDVGRRDPVLPVMEAALKQLECRAASTRVADEAERAQLMPLFFNESRGFRCEDAHRVLADHFQDDYNSDKNVYLVRGSRRIILSMKHWGTTCISSESLDGENLTSSSALEAVDKVIARYVDDRHENP